MYLLFIITLENIKKVFQLSQLIQKQQYYYHLAVIK